MLAAVTPQPTPKSHNPLVIWGAVLVIAAVVVFGSLWLSRSLWGAIKLPELPIAGQVHGEGVTFPERLGSEVKWDALKGKVVVAAYAYSRCPHGCSGVAAHFLKLRDLYGSRPDFHLVSAAVWPELDTVESFRSFAAGIGVKDSDPWWWISGDREKLWDFMTRQLMMLPSRIVPEADRLSPDDVVEHDLRAILIDKHQRVRGAYPVMDTRPDVARVALEKLTADIQRLLDEP